MNDETKKDSSLDVLGLGKAAGAIPDSVYEKGADVVASTFAQLIAPFTAVTAGFGRYLSQKFDNMVEAEKALATYAIKNAVARAEARSKASGSQLHAPESTKTFARTVEEVSKETDPVLHEMWTNLLASQLIETTSHPHFVELLSHFGPAEARTLQDVLPYGQVGANGGGLIPIGEASWAHWIRMAGEPPRAWTISCSILYDFGLVAPLVPSGQPDQKTVMLYRTRLGAAFMRSVSPSEMPSIAA